MAPTDRTASDHHLQSILASLTTLRQVGDLGEYVIELGEIAEVLADVANAARPPVTS